MYVITNELFDSQIAEHYRKLTIDHEKAYETLLVVNKMNRHFMGNTPESREILTEALRQPLQPFTPEQLRITFTDADSALEVAEETDPEMAEALRQEGNIAQLTANLDFLVHDRGLNSRLTTKLYQIAQVLEEAIATEPTQDTTGDSLNLIYNQNANAITQTIARIRQETTGRILDAQRRIIAIGHQLTETLYDDPNAEQFGAAAEATEQQVQAIVEELDTRLSTATIGTIPELTGSIERMAQGSLHQETSHRIERLTSAERESYSGIKISQGISELMTKIIERSAVNQSAMLAGTQGLRLFSGSPAHSAILTIGKTFGHSFRPWEAVKLARNIGRASVILSVGSIVLDVFMQIREDREQNRKAAALHEKRQQLRGSFGEVAENVSREAKTSVQTTIAELLETPLQNIREEQRRLNVARQAQNVHLQELNAVYASSHALIHHIHSPGTASET